MSYESEEDAIQELYNSGELSLNEYNEELRLLQRSYREEAEEAAQDAYDREMNNW